MDLKSLARLISLAAIWGASFLFMRMTAPVFGPAWMAFGRVSIAAAFLFCLARALKKNAGLREHAGHFAVTALLNSAAPFLLFGISAHLLSAAQLAVLNATAPVWGYIIGLALGVERPALRKVAGIALGLGGVVTIFGGEHITGGAPGAIAASLGAAFSYGLAAHYARRAKTIEPFANAYGSMCYAALMLAPALFFFPVETAPTAAATSALVAIGVVCSGVAYLLYFRLIRDIGPSGALTVTFLVPVFAMLWGAVFLGEAFGLRTLLGMAVTLAGTALVTGFDLTLLRFIRSSSARRAPPAR